MPPSGENARLFDALSAGARTVCGARGEHLLVDRVGELIRLDVVEGTTAAGPVVFHFDLVDDDRLDSQIAVMRALCRAAATRLRHVRLAGKLLALHALDAHCAGASLRESADILLGPGDWPGDGEHRKSFIRRLIAAGERMVRAGPREILSRN